VARLIHEVGSKGEQPEASSETLSGGVGLPIPQATKAAKKGHGRGEKSEKLENLTLTTKAPITFEVVGALTLGDSSNRNLTVRSFAAIQMLRVQDTDLQNSQPLEVPELRQDPQLVPMPLRPHGAHPQRISR
jgi:hypothetical protein